MSAARGVRGAIAGFLAAILLVPGSTLIRPAVAQGAAFFLTATDFPAGRAENGFSHYVEKQARSLPPSRTSFSVDFPLSLGRRFVWDTGTLLTSPGRWEWGDWLRLGIFTAATGGAFAADRTIDIESRIRHPRGSTEKNVEDAAQNLGNFPGIAAFVGGPVLFGLLTGNEQVMALGIDSGEAVVLSGAFTAALKDSIGRSRPIRGRGPFEFRPFSGNASMPSGHATAAFALAGALSEHLDNRWWIASPAYALASLVAFARTRASAHFASDVLVGGTIGAATARSVVTLETGRREATQGSSATSQVSILPAVGGDFRGLLVNIGF